MRDGLWLSKERVTEHTAKTEELRQATSIGIRDLKHWRFTQLNEGDTARYL